MSELRLETEQLVLRPFEARDLETFVAYRNDPEVARFQGWTMPFTYADAEAFLVVMQETEPGTPMGWYQIAVEVKATGEMIGDVAFFLTFDERQAEIGYTLARGAQGQGYATEAVRRLLAYLFDEFKVHRVRANCDPMNTASAKLLERVGMRREGEWIESLWFKGDWAGEVWYAILEREWRAQ